MNALAAHDESQEEDGFKALTAEEARQLRLRQASVSPWWVIAGQVLAGAVVALVALLWTGQRSAAWSAAYGSLAVVLPAALFARGLTGRFSSLNPGAAAVGFFLWEFVKIGVSVVLLAMAPRMVPGLSWPALLVALIVTLKVYWVALLVVSGRARKQVDGGPTHGI